MSEATLAVTETWADVEHLVAHVVTRFYRERGGDYHDLRSAGHFAFLRAYESYDGQTKFSTWVAYCVRCACLEVQRTSAIKRQRIESLAAEPQARHKFDLRTFLTELSEDARVVAEMAIESPIEVLLVLRSPPEEPSDSMAVRKRDGITWRGAQDMRSAITTVLKDMGWTAARIAESFQEIGEAL